GALFRLRPFPADLDVVQEDVAFDGSHHHAQERAKAGAGEIDSGADLGGGHFHEAVNPGLIEKHAAANFQALHVQVSFQMAAGESHQAGRSEPAQHGVAALVFAGPLLQMNVVAAQTAVNLRFFHEHRAVNLRFIEDDFSGKLGPAHVQVAL